MPLPKPDETEEAYMGRCMASDHMNSKYPDESQRAAVCHAIFRGGEKLAEALAIPKSKPESTTTRPCPEPALEAKAGDGKEDYGEIMGYAACFDNVDRQGDIIRKGAFAKSCRERVKAGKVLLMARHFAHGGDTAEAIGQIVEAREDDKGLYIRAKCYGSQLAQETREKIKTSPKAYGMSVGYVPVRSNDLADDTGAITGKELLELKLYEVTVTAVPANEETTAEAKSAVAPGLSLEALQARVEALEAKVECSKPKAPEAPATTPAAIHAFELARARRKRLSVGIRND